MIQPHSAVHNWFVIRNKKFCRIEASEARVAFMQFVAYNAQNHLPASAVNEKRLLKAGLKFVTWDELSNDPEQNPVPRP